MEKAARGSVVKREEMTGEKSRGDSPSLLKTGLALIGVVAGIVLFCYAAQVLLVFFAAIFLAVFFSGLAKLLQKYRGWNYPVCLALALGGLLIVLILTGLIVGPAVARQSGTLAEALPKAYHQLLDQIKSTEIGGRVVTSAHSAMDASKGSNLENGLKFAGLTVHGIGGLVFALVIGIFLSSQPDLYKNGLLALFPKKRRDRLAAVLEELEYTLWWWLIGQLMVMASVGILIGTGLTILGVPLSGTLGLLAAILAFIPSLGPLISVIPAIILGLTVSPSMGLWVCLLYLGVQILEANLISPLVQQKAISLPAALILGSELLMGLLLGGAGLAFATPLAAVGLVLVNMLYIQDYLGEKGSLPSRGSKS